MFKSIPDGVYPTMITPFTQDNKVDYNAVEQLLDWYAGRKVDGIFAICQSSEIFFLSFEEKLELIRFIMKNVPKGITVIGSGNTADDIETQIEEAKAYIQTGIDGYVFISNRLAEASEDDSVFLKNIEYAAKALPEISLGIYECPYPYKRLIKPEILRELASMSSSFRFIKDTCCDLEMLEAKIEAVKGTQLKIFNANAATLFESLKLGCSGYSGVMANFHPEIYSWLCKNYVNEPDKAQSVQDFVGFFSVAECQLYPVNAKYYLSLDGIDMGTKCRSKNDAEFTRNRQMEIEQMYNLTVKFKEQFAI